MRLPKSPYVYFRFVERAAGEMLISTGTGKGARADMARTVQDVERFAACVFWPRGNTSHTADRLTSNTWPGRPKGAVMLSYDGEQWVRWTGATQAELREVSRYASGLLADARREATDGK